MSTFEKTVVGVLVFIGTGLVVLFFWLFRLNTEVKQLRFGEATEVGTTTNGATNSAILTQMQENLDALQASSAALLERIQILEDSEPTTKIITTSTKQTFQKQIIHIGSASTSNTEWTNTGVEVTLNSADYPSDVNASFEVGLSIIGGEAWARLINKTTGAILSVTEVSAGSSTTTWKTSPQFKLHGGLNMYELQVRSSSSEVANASSARIILTK
ncbi:MAG: hypothetical protein BroJett025_01860 [Patescibacteria group bacterium]|nr:MAG: hypothetical protein BroJett025_01860 [Patescibacteria group bacterium]